MKTSSNTSLVAFFLSSLIISSPTYSAEPLSNEHKMSSILSQQEREYLQSTETLTVCSVAQAVGSNASIDIVQLITKKIGLKIKASEPMAWQEGILGLANGACDILPWATDTVERQKTMTFTRPYARIVRVLVTRNDQPYISSISQHLDKLFVTEQSNHVIAQLKQTYPDLLTKSYEHTFESLQAVANKEAFASISSLYSVGNLFNREEVSTLKIAGQLPPEFDDVVSLATRNDDHMLNQILDKAVFTTNQSEISKFMDKSAVFVYSTKVDYKKYWLIGISILILIGGLLWWIRFLRILNVRLELTQIELQKKSVELELLSTTDSLTNTCNRLKLDEVMENEIARSTRYSDQMSIIMLDIDHFKQVNDQYGHIIGDKVLRNFAKLLSDNLRDNDTLGRWGGEEFLIICPGIGTSSAKKVAEKLRMTIEKVDFSPVTGLTASFGVTEFIEDDHKDTLLSRADKALYQSKKAGRNKVTFN